MKKRVLFICTHNACRSQMAEGLLRLRRGEGYEAFSAGTAPSRVNPWAIRVMAELGADISGQIAEHVDAYVGQAFDTVVTTCDSPVCPVFPEAAEHIHNRFPDPSAAAGSDNEILAVFRRVRDEIDNWIQRTFPRTADSKRSEPA